MTFWGDNAEAGVSATRYRIIQTTDTDHAVNIIRRRCTVLDNRSGQPRRLTRPEAEGILVALREAGLTIGPAK